MSPEERASEGAPLRAIVTGASRGIGRAIAMALAAEGYSVLGTSRSGTATTPEASSQSGRFELAKLDLAEPASVDEFARSAPAPDILINNAGQSQVGAAEEVPPETLREIFEINFFGTVELTRRLLPAMRERATRNSTGKAWIINIGSLVHSFPIPFQSTYVASKSALAGYTASLRSELQPHSIEVTLIEPADIRTSIEPDVITSDRPDSPYSKSVQSMNAARTRAMNEAGSPDQIANTVLRLLKSGKPPKPFYPVGGHAPFFCFLKRLLPNTLVEKLVRKRYDLD